LNTWFRLPASAAILLVAMQAALGQSSVPLPATLGSEAEGDALENQSRKNGDTLIPTCRFEGARCGYINRDGDTVIAPQFDWVDLFAAGRALVKSGGKYGAIDAPGRFVIAPVYDSMSKFDRGLAVVLVGDRVGVIDQDGQPVVPPEHGPIVRISDNAFLVAEPPYGKPDGQLKTLGDRVGRSLPYAYGKRWGIVASGGAWIVPPTFAKVRAFSDELNGLFWAAESANAGARWQLMGPDGAPVSNELFDNVQQLQLGQDRAVVERGGRWGAINGRGDIVVDLKFNWLGYFRDGWAPYRLNGRDGRIDRDGNILSTTAAQPSMANRNTKVGSVTRLLGTDHQKCPNGRHLRFEGGRWTILAADDRPTPDVAFEYVQLVCNGPSVVKRDAKWGFIRIDGKLLADRYFDLAYAFHDGLATIVDNKQWAVIGEDGSFLLGPLKLARGVFVSGTGEYSIEFEEGYRKLDKALVAELARNPDVLTHRLPPRQPWSEGLAAQFDDKTSKWGFVDPARNFVIAPQFDAVSSFKNGAAWAAIPDRREWCQIDKMGNIKPGTRCQCGQPLVIVEHYSRPSDIACYDDGIRIVRGSPVIRGNAVIR
jgi:hypothetical protein